MNIDVKKLCPLILAGLFSLFLVLGYFLPMVSTSPLMRESFSSFDEDDIEDFEDSLEDRYDIRISFAEFNDMNLFTVAKILSVGEDMISSLTGSSEAEGAAGGFITGIVFLGIFVFASAALSLMKKHIPAIGTTLIAMIIFIIMTATVLSNLTVSIMGMSAYVYSVGFVFCWIGMAGTLLVNIAGVALKMLPKYMGALNNGGNYNYNYSNFNTPNAFNNQQQNFNQQQNPVFPNNNIPTNNGFNINNAAAPNNTSGVNLSKNANDDTANNFNNNNNTTT